MLDKYVLLLFSYVAKAFTCKRHLSYPELVFLCSHTVVIIYFVLCFEKNSNDLVCLMNQRTHFLCMNNNLFRSLCVLWTWIINKLNVITLAWINCIVGFRYTFVMFPVYTWSRSNQAHSWTLKLTYKGEFLFASTI